MKLKQIFNRILDIGILAIFILAMAITVIGLSLVTRPGTPDLYFIV